jgi:beta-xylosidase
MLPNIIAQKLPGPEFTATTKMDAGNLKQNEKAGLVMMGLDYASLTVSPSSEGFELTLLVCKNAYQGFSEEAKSKIPLRKGNIYLSTSFDKDGKCNFAYSTDGKSYKQIGEAFQVREGRWIGAKVGLFVVSSQETGLKGYADFDWFRIE